MDHAFSNIELSYQDVGPQTSLTNLHLNIKNSMSKQFIFSLPCWIFEGSMLVLFNIK